MYNISCNVFRLYMYNIVQCFPSLYYQPQRRKIFRLYKLTKKFCNKAVHNVEFPNFFFSFAFLLTKTTHNMSETKTKSVSPQRNKDHDDFVRGLFSYTEFVYKILQYALPDDLKPYIDFSESFRRNP